MKHVYAFIIVLMLFISHSVHAVYWVHSAETAMAGPLDRLSAIDIIGSQLNHFSVQWRPGDVVLIKVNGESFHVKFTIGGWSSSVSPTDITQAKKAGTIVTEEGQEGDINCPPDKCRRDGSPLLIDLNNDGFELGAPGSAVMFDMFSVGFEYKMQWVKDRGDEAFLAIDLNRNGRIDDGSELFGEGTKMILSKNEPAKDGYEALIQYDSKVLGGNEDGKIDSNDAVWDRLTLWLDDNADGDSAPNELQALQESGIESISLKAKKSNKSDEAGNRFKKWSWVTQYNSNKKSRMADVYFAFVK